MTTLKAAATVTVFKRLATEIGFLRGLVGLEGHEFRWLGRPEKRSLAMSVLDRVSNLLPVPYGQLPPEEPGPFAPCLLLTDKSSSTGGAPIAQINKGLSRFERD